MRVVMLPMAATPDHDRNGMINAEDSDKATSDNPYAMWINDNNSIYAEPHFGDVPGSGVDNGALRQVE